MVGLSDLRRGDGRRSPSRRRSAWCWPALIVTSLGAGLCFAPALTMLSEAAESSRLHQGFAAGLSNMAWASGQVVGGARRRRRRQRRRQRGAERRDRRPAAGHRRLRVPGASAAGGRSAARAERTRLCADHGFGRGEGRDGRAWRNWAGDQTCRPAEWLRPRDRDELAEAVAAAAAAGRKVSVAGSGHSFTEAAMTDGTMIDVEALSGVIDADPASGLVKVGGGTVLADLNEELHGLGLAMENLGDIDRQTIAGAISTGTHGTGARLRNISAQVEGMELVLADGSVRELSADADPELLRAARVGDRRPRRDLRGDPALRSRLHAAPGRHAAPARGGARHLPGARRRPRPLRALHLPLRRLRPGAGAQPHRRAAAPARPRRRLPQRRRARELGAGGALGGRQALPARDPVALAARRPARLRQHADRPQRPRSSPTSAASASPRWSTGCRASTAPRRCGG